MSAENEPILSTSRLDQVMELAAQGHTDKEIATHLGISPHTVATYWKRVREKLNVTNRASAVNRFLQNRVDQQHRQLQETHAEVERLNRARHGGMSALLGETQRRVVELEARIKSLDFLERASQVAHAVAYELQSVAPINYRSVSASAHHFGMDVRAILASEKTFYEQIVPEDLALIYEQFLDAAWLPNERYLFLYRVQMPEARWVFDTHQGFYHSDGTLAGVLGIATDVHDLVLAGLIQPVVLRVVVPAVPIPSPPQGAVVP